VPTLNSFRNEFLFAFAPEIWTAEIVRLLDQAGKKAA
jgi:hypothetical protein